MIILVVGVTGFDETLGNVEVGRIVDEVGGTLEVRLQKLLEIIKIILLGFTSVNVQEILCSK